MKYTSLDGYPYTCFNLEIQFDKSIIEVPILFDTSSYVLIPSFVVLNK